MIIIELRGSGVVNVTRDNVSLETSQRKSRLRSKPRTYMDSFCHLYLAKVSGVSNWWRAAKVPESLIPFPHEVASVSFTAALLQDLLVLAGDATDASSKTAEMRSVCRTEAAFRAAQFRAQ